MSCDPQHPDWLRRVLWLRFVPVKLHLVLFWIGGAVGQHLGGQVGLVIGIILGVAIGVPLQLLKHICRRAATAQDASIHPAATAGCVTRIQPMPGGLDLNYGRNIRQLVAGLAMAALGAPVGYLMAAEAKYLAAIVGGVFGFVAGVFMFGVVLLALHYAPELRRWLPERDRIVV